jgi:hypothetical protein
MSKHTKSVWSKRESSIRREGAYWNFPSHTSARISGEKCDRLVQHEEHDAHLPANAGRVAGGGVQHNLGDVIFKRSGNRDFDTHGLSAIILIT